MATLNDLKNISILYADDDAILRESTTNTLKTLFKQVYSAKDGDEALEFYANNKDIQIVMLDIKMGALSGIDVVKTIRLNNETIPIFLVSSYTEVEDLLDSIKLNLVEYLIKPIAFQKLIETFLICLQLLEKNNSLLQHLCEHVNYNPTAKEVISFEKKISLTKNEIQVLELLIAKRGQIINYKYFTSKLGYDVSDIALQNTVSRLRKKINCDALINIAKVGYMLR